MINMENREKLFKQYKSDCPQTIGETDTAFDNDNFIDWLCQQNKQLLNKIDMLKFQLKAADSVNDVLEKLRTSDNEAWSKQCAEWMTKHEQIWNECLSANNKIDELEKLLLNK